MVRLTWHLPVLPELTTDVAPPPWPVAAVSDNVVRAPVPIPDAAASEAPTNAPVPLGPAVIDGLDAPEAAPAALDESLVLQVVVVGVKTSCTTIVQFRVEPEATATSAPPPGPDAAAVVPGVAGPAWGGAAAAAVGAPVNDWVELSDVLGAEGALLMLVVAGGFDDVTTEVPTPGKGTPGAPEDGAVHGKTRPRLLSAGELDQRASADVAA